MKKKIQSKVFKELAINNSLHVSKDRQDSAMTDETSL